jgi:hypothetical protein
MMVQTQERYANHGQSETDGLHKSTSCVGEEEYVEEEEGRRRRKRAGGVIVELFTFEHPVVRWSAKHGRVCTPSHARAHTRTQRWCER